MTNAIKDRNSQIKSTDLLKASLIIFIMNGILALWFYVSPNLTPIEVRDHEPADSAASAEKISPFTEVVDVHVKRRPVKTAEKIRPILYQEQPEAATMPAETSSISYTDSYDAGLSEAADRRESARHVATVRVPVAQTPESDLLR